MTHTLYETIQKIVQDELKRTKTAQLAIVEEQHPHVDESDSDNYACTIALRDSGIVLKNVPVATSKIGTASIPAVGDMVMVQFIGGNINAPVITGCLYNDETRPPLNDDSQIIMHHPQGAEDSDATRIEILSGPEKKLVIKLGDALELNLADDDPVVEIKIDGGKGNLTIARDGAVLVQSDGKIEIKGNEINIEAQAGLKLKGQTIDLN